MVKDDIFAVALAKVIPQLDRIIEIIKNKQLINVSVLVYYNDSVEIVRDYFISKGIPVEWKTKDNMEFDFDSTNPKIVTWHCSKGLEFDDVFIPACGIYEHMK